MINKLMAVGFASALFSMSATAAENPVTPVSPVLQMTMEDGALTGDGADAIIADIKDSQFILVGEDHGFADPPEIAAALARVARPFGFNHHVIEAGPVSVDWAANILRRDGVDGLAEGLRGRSLALPFLTLREDAMLASEILSAGGTLWGVDQEFVGGPLIIFEILAERAKGSKAKTEINALLAAEQDAFATGNQGALFLFSADDAAFSKLESLFPRDKTALEIIAGLRESADIYQTYGRGDNFGSNTARIALIRRQFLEAYHAAREDVPKVIFKMGALHTGLGSTYLNTFDLGSLTEGIAAANDMKVLRVVIYPLDGKQTQIRPSAAGPFHSADYHSDEVEVLLGLAGINSADISEQGWSVVALAPIRHALGQKGIGALSKELKFTLLGYDYLVTTRGARAATPLEH